MYTRYHFFIQDMLPCNGETEGYLHYSALKGNSFIQPQRKGDARVCAEAFICSFSNCKLSALSLKRSLREKIATNFCLLYFFVPLF